MIEFCPLYTSGYRVPEVTCINKYKMSRALSHSPVQGFHRVDDLLIGQLVYG